MKRLFLGALLIPCLAGAAGVEVRFPGPGLELVGRLYLPEGVSKAPAVVLLHGCSGMWARSGAPTKSYVAWAEHLQRSGFAALLVDSFGPRGAREICTQKERHVSAAADRPHDAHAALRWLAGEPYIRAGKHSRARLVQRRNDRAARTAARLARARSRPPRFRSGVAFYPGCAGLYRGNYRPDVPLLIQAGGADDWTPARFCERLVAESKAQGALVAIDVYAGAHHAFDRVDGRVRHRPEVRNPSSPTGWGATVGPNPAARAKSLEQAITFLKAQR